MARIVGVDIPNEKVVWVALTYVHGIGKKSALDILRATKIASSAPGQGPDGRGAGPHHHRDREELRGGGQPAPAGPAEHLPPEGDRLLPGDPPPSRPPGPWPAHPDQRPDPEGPAQDRGRQEERQGAALGAAGRRLPGVPPVAAVRGEGRGGPGACAPGPRRPIGRREGCGGSRLGYPQGFDFDPPVGFRARPVDRPGWRLHGGQEEDSSQRPPSRGPRARVASTTRSSRSPTPTGRPSAGTPPARSGSRAPASRPPSPPSARPSGPPRRPSRWGSARWTCASRVPGTGRESAIRSLQARGLKIRAIEDVTPLPHNGCRPRKRRRV